MEREIARRAYRRRLVAAAVATCALVACAAPGPENRDGGVGGTVDACAGTPGQLAVDRVNGIRERHELAPLRTHGDLIEAALRHSRDQATAGGVMAHIGSDGSAPGDRVEAAGYPWALVSENVGAGYASAFGVVRAWMESPPHRGTILSPRATHVGVGYVRDPTTRMRHFWTLIVAAPQASGAGAGLACHP